MKSNLRNEIKSYICLLYTSGIHAVAQQRAHDQPDAAFAFAALTDEHEHFLPLGGRQQAVAQKLLQGGNVLRLQHHPYEDLIQSW